MFLDRFRKPAPKRAVLALYDDPDRLLNAARAALPAQLVAASSRTSLAALPALIDGARTRLALPAEITGFFLPLASALFRVGATLGLTFEIWTQAIDWPINVGGKPNVSLPAFIPIFFESGVLIGGTMTLAGLLLACGLPNFKGPILDRNLTNDRFGLYVPEYGPGWNQERTLSILRRTGPVDIKVIHV